MNAIDRVFLLADQLLDCHCAAGRPRAARQLGNVTVVFDALSTVLAPMIAEPAAREIWDRALARSCRDYRGEG